MDAQENTKPDIAKTDDGITGSSNVLYERFLFNTREQLEGENISTFVQNLRKLIQTCNYVSSKDETIIDRLICGIRDKRIQKHLINEGNEVFHDFTLEKALQIAEKKEHAIETTIGKPEEDQKSSTPSSPTSLGMVQMDI